MALSMITKTIVVFLIVFMIFAGHLMADEESAAESIKAAWTAKMLQESHDDLKNKLVANGVSAQDAEQIVFNFASEISICILDAARESASRRSLDFEQHLTGLDSEDMKSLFRDEGEFNELTQPCAYLALEKTGILLD